MDLYFCDVHGCMKSYKSKVNLKRHKEAFHSDTKSFECQICSKVLSSKQNLNEHVLLHSNVLPFLCTYEGCNKRFRHGSQYSAHKKVHSPANNTQSMSLKNLDISATTRLLSAIKDHVPILVKDNGTDLSLELPLIGVSQVVKLPDIEVLLSGYRLAKE